VKPAHQLLLLSRIGARLLGVRNLQVISRLHPWSRVQHDVVIGITALAEKKTVGHKR
jgi:hypothetical protein